MKKFQTITLLVLFLVVIAFFLIQSGFLKIGTGQVTFEDTFTNELDVGDIRDPGVMPVCGNGICGKGETITSCPEDCRSVINQSCTDSDNGIELFIRGTCVREVFYSEGGNADGTGDVCSADLTSLKECYCEEDSLESIEVDCEFGCFAGACLAEQTNYTLQENITCTESDFGDAPFIYGSCSETIIFPEGENSSTGWDRCLNETLLFECSCGLSGLEVIPTICENGCFEGACVSLEENQSIELEEIDLGECSETDLGRDYYLSGVATSGEKEIADTCYDKNTLLETYCLEGDLKIASFDCLNGCFGGMCLPESAFGVGDITFPCNDSDGGLNYPIKGFANDGMGTLVEDNCIEEGPYAGYLFEYYCDEVENEEFSNDLNYKYVACENGCFEGACNSRGNWFTKFFEDLFS